MNCSGNVKQEGDTKKIAVVEAGVSVIYVAPTTSAKRKAALHAHKTPNALVENVCRLKFVDHAMQTKKRKTLDPLKKAPPIVLVVAVAAVEDMTAVRPARAGEVMAREAVEVMVGELGKLEMVVAEEPQVFYLWVESVAAQRLCRIVVQRLCRVLVQTHRRKYQINLVSIFPFH